MSDSIAVVVNECQRGSIGDLALWPALRDASEPIIPVIARLLDAARAEGVPVLHVLGGKREDLRGANDNAPLFAAARRSGGLRLGTPAVDLVPELGPHETDIIEWKVPGLSPFPVTGIDAILRNLGVDTIAVCGVSLNAAIPSIAFDAVNRGYKVVIVSDGVAGVPEEYGALMLQHTLALVARIVPADELIEAWR
jgi:nicotinamidase-related amidase